MDMQLILASASPRRRELINILRLPVECISIDADESLEGTPTPEEAAVSVAARKAKAAAALDRAEGKYIVAADTMVVVDGEIYGKPTDEADARRRQRSLLHDLRRRGRIRSPHQQSQ